jgi:uncharacterized protein
MALKYEQVQFGYSKSETFPSRCRNCALLKNCWGECPKGRVLPTAGGEPGLNYLCAGSQQFFTYATSHVEYSVADIRRQGGWSTPRTGLGI